MRFRKLRIAWSVEWGVACLLLIVLWVRDSRQIRDQVLVRYSASHFLWIVSEPGRLIYIARPASQVTDSPETNLIFRSQSQARPKPRTTDKFGKSPSMWRIQVLQFGSRPELYVPKWMIVVVALALSVAPWPFWKWHYSLRTLLIGTTLVAVVLGWIVYAIR